MNQSENKSLIMPKGVKIKDLVKFLEELPENGDIWVETDDGLSNFCSELWVLNKKDVILVAAC